MCESISVIDISVDISDLKTKKSKTKKRKKNNRPILNQQERELHHVVFASRVIIRKHCVSS